MIIWNFMEELWRKYQDTTKDGRQPTFHLNEFTYTDVFEKYLPIVGIKESKTDSIILDALLEYEQRGYNIVSITERRLAECRKSVHDCG